MNIDVRGLMATGMEEWRKVQFKAPTYFFKPAFWFTPNTLPVVGIDAVVAQDIIFALRAVDRQGDVADAWLRAVQCAQLAHDRLLRDLHDVDRHLTFWQRQLSAGGVWSHGAFMLLSRGPASFLEDVAGAARGGAALLAPALPQQLALALRMRVRPPRRSHQEQQQQQQEGERKQLTAAAGPSASRPGPSSSLPPPKSPSSPAAARGSSSATDMMQQRVLLLRGLRLRLAQALAELVGAAGHLRVGDLIATAVEAVAPPGERPGQAAGATGGAVAAGGGLPPVVSFAAAAAAVAEGRMPSSLSGPPAKAAPAVEHAVRTAVRGMLMALRGLMSYAGPDSSAAAAPDSQQPPPPPGAAAADRPLSLELQDLLDMLRLQTHAVQALGLVSERQPPSLIPSMVQTVTRLRGQQRGQQLQGAPQASGAVGDGADGSVDDDRPAGLHLISGDCSAAAALSAARRSAALAGPLVPLPATARMPSRFQRHWLRYCAVGGLLLYGGAYLVRHSRLAGSDDLDRWILTAATAVRSALRTHVAEPLAAVRDELFRTFRDRPAIVSAEDFSLSRESLLRMLAAFASDHNPTDPGPPAAAAAAAAAAADALPSSGAADTSAAASGGSSSTGGTGTGIGASEQGAGDDAALAAGMAVLMRSYEAELRHPLRNLLLGDLARALLIQVQHVKVDGEAAMLRLDQILRANELSLSLVAALPALGVSLAVASGAARLLIPRAPDPKRAALPSRLAMASLEVALTRLAAAEEQEERRRCQQRQQQQQQQEGEQQQQQEGEGEAGTASSAAAVASAAVEELRGLVGYRLDRVYAELTALYATADRTSRFSEWRQLYDDLLRLAAPAPPLERLATHQRMMRTYTVFQR